MHACFNSHHYTFNFDTSSSFDLTKYSTKNCMMRFLCLHGRGTNVRIFQEQIAKIREALGSDNEFIFVQGRVPTQDTPGMPTLLSLSDRFGFVPLNAEPAVYKDFFEEMQYFIELNGPFDGLIGFSEGASIAITLLIEDARSSFAKFKCAVLFCTLKTVDLASLDQDSGSGDKLCFLERDERDVESEYPIKIPTAHIWSNTDDVACGASEKAMRLCEQAFVESLVHDLGHDIPGSHTDKFVAETVNIVERTIERGKEISVP